MAKNKKFHKRGNGIRVPLAVVAGFAPLATNVYNVSGGGIPRMLWMGTQAITGYDTDTGKWWGPNLMKGTVPIMLGIMVHKIAGRLGVNRAIGSAGIPFIRI